MNFRFTSIMFGILIFVLFLFGIVVEQRRGVTDKGFLFPLIQENLTIEVNTVEIDREGVKYTFTKTDEGWMGKPSDSSREFRLNDTQIESLIDSIRTMRENEKGDKPREKGKAGLKPPQMSITLTWGDTDKERRTLHIGRVGDVNGFVSTGKVPEDILVVKASALEKILFEDIDSLRSRELLQVNSSNAQEIQLEQAKKKPKVVDLYLTDEGKWRFREPDYGFADFVREGSLKKTPGVKDLLDAVGGLQVDDFEPMGKRSFSDYGLAKGNASVSIAVKFSQGKKILTQTLLIGNKEEDKDQYYARLDADQFVVRIDADKLKPVFEVLEDPKELRSRDLTFVSLSAPDAIDVFTGPELKEVLKFRQMGATSWKMFRADKSYEANAQKIDGTDGLLDALQGRGQIEEFKDEASDQELGFDNPEAKVMIYVGAVDPKERDKGQLKEGAQAEVELLFGRIEKDQVFVKRTIDQKIVDKLAVPASILEKVTPDEGYLAFLEDELPSFDIDKVTKLELQRDGATFTVEKKKANDKSKEETWQQVEPEDPVKIGLDEQKVQEVLTKLKSLSVKNWVEKVSKDTNLKPFNLQPPPLTVTLTLKKDKQGKETETRVFKFGEKEGKKPGAYALVSTTDIVFLTNPDTVKFLKDVELRDHTIFDFDADKVREVTLYGKQWDDKLLTSIKLNLKRESAKDAWSVSPKLTFTFSQIRANQFVQKLANLDCQRFVELKGGLTAPYKYESKYIALNIELKLEDDETYTLKIGKKDEKEEGFYAEASSLPGIVILLPEAEFGALVETKTLKYFGQ